MTAWRTDPVFEYLADELANDRVVFLTGAGISLDLRDDQGRKLPSWLMLLRGLQNQADAAGQLTDARDRADLDLLLADDPPPSSTHFLEAATILSAAVGDDFPEQISEATRSAANATTNLHRAVHRCAPRAIVTFNYDEGHEAAARELDAGVEWDLILAADPILARSEESIRLALAPDGLRRKLIKAHGSVTEPRSLVLTRESYREVLVRRPAYRALLNQIFVNYTVVAVGFGMDDPDFQLTLDMLERDVGGSLRRHVYLARAPVASANATAECEAARQQTVMRRRYGFEPLFCNDWSELPAILSDLTTLSGPQLRTTVDASIDPLNVRRGAAHLAMSRLSESGAIRAVNLIEEKLAAESDDWRRAEWCYSLGRIRPKQAKAKALLKACVEDRGGIRSIANAVIGFVEHADAGDIPWLEAQLARWESDPHPDANGAADPHNRVKAYLEYAIQKTRAKHASWNGPQ